MDTMDPQTGEIIPGCFMPPALAKAIVAVAGKVKRLGVNEKNQHGGYQYVSVDKMYETIGPLMAAEGLALMIDEIESEVREGAKGNPWLFVRFALSFVHESGAMSNPVRRSCAQPISGPQAFGAAQSYIEKQFLRQVFKVPTGEKDADDTAPQENAAPARSGARTAQGSPGGYGGSPKPQQAAPEPSGAPAEDAGEVRAEAIKRYNEIKAEIDKAKTPQEVDGWLTHPLWGTMSALVMKALGDEAGAERVKRLRDHAERIKADLEMGA